MTQLPESAQYVVVGAGVHGLSVAWHLAERGLFRAQWREPSTFPERPPCSGPERWVCWPAHARYGPSVTP